MGGVTLLLLTIFAPAVLAQSGGPYGLTWSVIAGGGGTMSGGTFSVIGTIGQPEAGTIASGGTYGLSGGVWGGPGAASPPAGVRVYLPLVLR